MKQNNLGYDDYEHEQINMSNNSVASILSLLYANSSASIKETKYDNNNNNINNKFVPQNLVHIKSSNDNSNKNMDNLRHSHLSSRLINILPHTDSRDLRLNSSVDELFNKFSNESMTVIYSFHFNRSEENFKILI